MNKQLIEKVSNFLLKEYNTKVSDVSILQLEDGTYEFFNRYLITKENFGYKIIVKNESKERLFSNLKNAVAWCIFYHKNKLEKTKRIEYLDTMLGSMELNIQIHNNLVNKSTDLETKFIYLAKLDEDRLKKKHYLAEINGYIRESKMLQTQKFTSK